jgi:hypothetical protein
VTVSLSAWNRYKKVPLPNAAGVDVHTGDLLFSIASDAEDVYTFE